MGEWLARIYGWWWDERFLAQIDAFTGIASLILGTAIGVFAWRIAKRQMDMQAEQHTFFEEQLAKRTDIRMLVDGVDTRASSDAALRAIIRFSAHNGGRRSSDGFYWELLVPEALEHQVTFVDPVEKPIDAKWSHVGTEEVHRSYRKNDGHYVNKLFPYSGVEVARVSVKITPDTSAFCMYWRIRADDGMVPPEGEGLAFLKFKRLEDGTYSWSRWHRGQKESDIQ